MRSSGILMHITSLPGPWGIGTLGKEAFAFVDFLEEAGQRCWQLLPLNPTGYGDSPYQSCSAYAGNHYLIDLDLLVENGLLRKEELESVTWCRRDTKVDFGRLYTHRPAVLRKAFSRFPGSGEFDRFCADSESWLPDFALFMALKDKHGGKPWYEWEEALKFREPEALAAARAELAADIRFYQFVQYLFDTQWSALRTYANSKGVKIIGDVPIYVPLDSVEVWTEPQLFQLDEHLTPTAVAGCPPDAFTADGQLWGNPLYRWDRMAEDNFSWWIRRLSAAGAWYDVIRFDHFRGFESYWSVPHGDTTARNGKWVPGPGMAFVNTVKQQLPHLQMIAEDLGYLTPEVLALRDGSGFPGMKLLQFAFDSREPSEYLPHTYGANSVCYTGTHDNVTTRQWFETAGAEAVEYARAYMGLRRSEGYVWGMIRTAFASVSDLCVIPMQDFLNLGAQARMNFPGTMSDKNWTWRVKNGMINHMLARRIRELTVLYGRLAQTNS